MKNQKYFLPVIIAIACLVFHSLAFSATALTLYDDFNDNMLDPAKWLAEPSENAGAITEDNGSLQISGRFYQNQGAQAFLLGPEKSFDALEAKFKLTSETGVVQGFGIGAILWNDGDFDYMSAIYFTRLHKDDPLAIMGYVDRQSWQTNPFTASGEVFLDNASYDTWYRVRIEREGAQVNFYVKEGAEAFEPDDLKYTYAIQGAVESPLRNLAFLDARNLAFFETVPLSGFFDDVAVGKPKKTYTLSGRIEGTLCDNAGISLYQGAFPRETTKVNADGTYAFRSLSDQKTYTVGSASLCCPLAPNTKSITIQGDNQTGINFTVQPDTASTETVYAITGGMLIDGNGGKPVNDALIIVKGDTIQSVSRAGETAIPTGAQVIDATGKTIIPGLHDMHTHVLGDASPLFYPDYVRAVGVDYRKNLNAYLFCGVTSVFDAGSMTQEDMLFSLRQQEQAHCLLAPRIFTGGAGITYPHGYCFPSRVASTPEEAVRTVDDLAERKPDRVKILYENTNPSRQPVPTFDSETLKALIDESRLKGLKTTVHIRVPELGETAAPLQPDAFGHVPSWFGDRTYEQEMIKNHISCTPTLMAAGTARMMFCRDPDLIHDDFHKACLDTRLAGAYQDPVLLEVAHSSRTLIGRIMGTIFSFPQRFGALRRLYRAGTTIILGTDAGVPAVFHGAAAHEELRLYVKAGLTPLQAITTATRNGAEYVGKLDQQGTIEAGKLADLVILNANPLRNIRNTKKIALVMKDGKIMDRGMLSRDITGRLSEETRYIADRIDLMPASAFKDSDPAHKTALTGQIEQIYSLLKQADDNETSQQNYSQASQILSDTVMPLLDGCANGSTGDDLITDCAYQNDIYSAARQLVDDCVKQ